MIEDIENILHGIHQNKDKQNGSISLLGGEAGYALFDILYIKYFGNNEIGDTLQDKIQLIAENSYGVALKSFCGGQAGINWFFNYLFKHNYIDGEDWQLLCADGNEQANNALTYFEGNNYDFLHGALGIAYYLLEHEGFKNQAFFETTFDRLFYLMGLNGHAIPDRDLVGGKLDLNTINLGLAHGLISVLKYCIQCHKKGVCTAESEALANRIADFLISVKNADSTLSYFPTHFQIGVTEYKQTRLGWCYGDLTLAFVLYQYGVYFNKLSIRDLALEVLLHCTKRRLFHETMVKDAGLCHGSAGIAHVFNKMFNYTGNPVFKEACEHWLSDTINRTEFEDNEIIYPFFNGVIGAYKKDLTLLSGTPGIGLVLLSYLTGDFTWDYCLMLND